MGSLLSIAWCRRRRRFFTTFVTAAPNNGGACPIVKQVIHGLIVETYPESISKPLFPNVQHRLSFVQISKAIPSIMSSYWDGSQSRSSCWDGSLGVRPARLRRDRSPWAVHMFPLRGGLPRLQNTEKRKVIASTSIRIIASKSALWISGCQSP